MENDNTSIEANDKKSFFARVYMYWQWLVCIIVSAMSIIIGTSDPSTLHLISESQKYVFLTSVAFLLLTGLTHAPKIHSRLSGKWKVFSYIVIIPAIAFCGAALGPINDAIDKTPEGMKAASARKAEDEKQRLAEQRQDALEQKALKAREAAEAKMLFQANRAANLEKLEECRGIISPKIKDLVRHVKDQLHNPGAFEHVETLIHYQSDDSYNVSMRFRAENAFGALRESSVSALIDPETCMVEDLGRF